MVRFSTVIKDANKSIESSVKGSAKLVGSTIEKSTQMVGSTIKESGQMAGSSMKKVLRFTKGTNSFSLGKGKKQESIEDLIAENEQLRARVRELEAALAQAKLDFEAQEDLRSFGGLSMLRAENVTIGKQLGQGSFGAVYRGQWRGVKVRSMPSSEENSF